MAPSSAEPITIQAKSGGSASKSEAEQVHEAAAHGTSGPGGTLPYIDQIQKSFGEHNVSHVQAHTDQIATEAARAMRAEAYTTGEHVAFAGAPSLHTAAHEAAHVVQQRGGVQLKGGVGEVSDAYERHADQVADRVVAGHSAEALLDEVAGVERNGKGQVQAKDVVGEAIQRQPNPQQGACYPTNRRSSPEHEAIQAHYIGTIDPTGVREYAIPGGSTSGAVGYADLVSLGTGAIYEIKPYAPNEIADGLVQVAAYVAAARLSCHPNLPWHPGVAYPDSVIPFGPQELVAKQYSNPGLILYYRRQRRPEPVPVPVPDREREAVPERQPIRRREINWQTVWEVLAILGLSISLVVVVAAALADPEPASKLALAGLSATMIIAILDAFGIEHNLGRGPAA